MTKKKTKKKLSGVKKRKPRNKPESARVAATKERVKNLATNEKRILHIAPGTNAFQDFLLRSRDMFNLTEFERIAGLPNGTLRHISTGKRVATPSVYAKLQEKLLPKLCEGVFILQNYSGQMLQKEIDFDIVDK